MLGGGEELNNVVSIPVGGGPIYVGDMVGPLTTVPHFETCAFRQLESLKQEILYAGDSLSICDDEEDISVDELKIIGEDEFVRKAFEEAFKDDDQSANPTTTTTTTTGDDNGKKPNKKPSGGKRNNKRKLDAEKNNNPFNESYIAKVEELAKLKQKQEEDKATVRLHSFNSRVSKPDTITSQLKSASCVTTKVRPSSSTSNNLPVHFPEVVLSLEVYHHSKTRLKTQEFLVLGRQFLTEVRDKIHCVTDEMMKKAGQYDPSGYFFIEDVFCNDTRDPTAIDYSKPILDWLKNSKDDALEKWDELQHEQKGLLPELKSVQMQKTRFCDIAFRLGAGYVYCHQGDCKHVIVIRNMRLIHPEDVQNRAAYPLITYELKLRYKKCSVCNIYRAKKMTVDDKWASLNPCYFCDVCYYMLHYGNGSLLYSDFAVYDYHHE